MMVVTPMAIDISILSMKSHSSSFRARKYPDRKPRNITVMKPRPKVIAKFASYKACLFSTSAWFEKPTILAVSFWY